MKKVSSSTAKRVDAQLSSSPYFSYGSTLKKWLWPLVGLILTVYGFLALNSGMTLSPLTNKADNNAEVATYIYNQAKQGIDMTGTPEVKQVVPAWANLMAELSSSDYAYGEDSAQDIQISYYSMEESGRTVLSTHMMLGLVLMSTGFLQFWPAFRRRFRKTHRVLGAVYIVGAIASMTLSGKHLLDVGIENTFNTYVFFTGLWFLLIGVLLSISIASYSLIRKDIARHLGWQALGFGFLLTAPIQRIDWLFFSAFATDASFNESNLMVNCMLFVQATLASLCFFMLNRGSSPVRASTPLNWKNIGVTGQILGYATIVGLALTLFIPIAFYGNLNDIAFLQSIISVTALNALSTSVSGPYAVIFAVACTMLLAAGWSKLVALRNGTAKPSNSLNLSSISIIAASAIVVVAIAFQWAYQIGMSSHEHSLAGGGFAVFGTLLLGFFLFMVNAFRNNEQGKAVEYLQLLLLTATAPAMMLINCYLINMAGVIPYEYFSKNAGYEIAVIGAVFNPLFIGYLLTIYSAETARYRIS